MMKGIIMGKGGGYTYVEKLKMFKTLDPSARKRLAAFGLCICYTGFNAFRQKVKDLLTDSRTHRQAAPNDILDVLMMF